MFAYGCKSTAVIALMLAWPAAVWAQTPPPPQQPAAARPTAATGVIPQVSRDLSQDTQFLALLRARDGQFALVGELRRIVTYHDNFRGRLERILNNLQEPLPREQLINQVDKALTRLQQFESEVKNAESADAKMKLYRVFEEEYPVFRADPGGPRRTAESRETERALSAQRDFVQRERTNANEVFQNISLENRDWLTKYEKLFAQIELRLNALTTGALRVDRLPPEFFRLSGASSQEALTPEQLQIGIDRYRAALRNTLSDVTAAPPPLSFDAIRTQLATQIDGLGQELHARSTEASAYIHDLEKNISATAKSLYGNKVGADSFNYLLIVFALVFAVLMVMPKFYAENVQINILKSEFLLQFSTVFVLIAAIIILGIGELIDKQQLPVLLAGISGYVLGQLGKV